MSQARPIHLADARTSMRTECDADSLCTPRIRLLLVTTVWCAVGIIITHAVSNAALSAERAVIPFANLGGIRNWRAADNRTLYVQGRNDRWYLGELSAPCLGLDSANRIGFVVEPSGSFDKLSSVVVDGRECRLKSLTQTEAPGSVGDRKSGSGPGTPASGAAGTSVKDGQPGQSVSEPAPIPFAELGGIQHWRVVDNDTLGIEGRNGRWYRAELFAPCPGLELETVIGFVVEPTGSSERLSSITVGGHQCQLKSLSESEEPASEAATQHDLK